MRKGWEIEPAYMKRSPRTTLRILFDGAFVITSEDTCLKWELLINGLACEPNPIITYSFYKGKGSFHATTKGLMLGLCRGITVGDIRISITIKRCDGKMYIPPNGNNDPYYYIISELNMGTMCPTDSIFNVISHMSLANTLIPTSQGHVVVATFKYSKLNEGSLLQIIVIFTMTALTQCYRLFMTFDGMECRTPIEGTLWTTLITNEYHKQTKLFGLCPDLKSGQIIIALNLNTCETTEAIFPDTLNIADNSGIHFEASEIRPMYIPHSFHTGLPTVFNIKPFILAANKRISMSTTNGAFQLTYNKYMNNTALYVMGGFSFGGKYPKYIIKCI